MFKALYEYGKQHPEICIPFGCKYRKLDWVVELSATGNLTGVRHLSDKIMSPDVGSKAFGVGNSNVCIDKASIVLLFEESGKPIRQREHKMFMSYFENYKQEVPVFGIIADVMSNEDMVDAICATAESAGVKPTDTISFAVSNVLVPNCDDVIQWWSSLMKASIPDADKECTALDVITGEPCVPIRLIDPIPISAAGGGQPSGVTIISFDKDPFNSYGFKNGENCPMSQDTADTIVNALRHLGNKAPKVAGMKFIHWYSHDVNPEDDIFLQMDGAVDASFDSDDDDDKQKEAGKRATDLVKAPVYGTPPAELSDVVYHIMIVCPEGARLAVRYYGTGSYEQLYRNVAKWYEDMELVSWDGNGRVGFKKFGWFMYKLGLSYNSDTRDMPDDKKYNRRLYDGLMRACMDAGSLPNMVLSKALSDIRSSIYTGKTDMNPGTLQMLKMYLNRQPNKEKGDMIMADTVTCKHVGYQCGRLLAVYVKLQRWVDPDVNKGALERFYSSCCQSPGKCIGWMQSSYTHWIEKMESYRYRKVFDELLSEMYETIDVSSEDIPSKLSAIEQGYFAIGYWHGMAYVNKRISEVKAAKDAAGKVNDKEELEDGNDSEQD